MAVIEHSGDAIATAVETFGSHRILAVRDGSHLFDIKHHVNQLITQAWAQSASTIVIPVDCLPEEFFQLRSGVAVAMIISSKVCKSLTTFRLSSLSCFMAPK